MENSNNDLLKTIETFRKTKKAIPAVTVNNLETIKAAMQVSNELNYPVILMCSPSGAKYFGSFEVVKNIFDSLKKSLKAKKVFLHLDHSLSIEDCKKAIDLKFDSVMFDGSKLPLEENIKKTKEVVDYAKNTNILVEGEIGEVGGKEDEVEAEISLANVETIERFYNETKVHLLAASIGTVHGAYKSAPKINFAVVEKLSVKKIFLVLHGSSGLNDDTIKKLISLNEVKINVNTKNQETMIEELRQSITSTNIMDIRHVGELMQNAFKKSLKESIGLFKNV